jgi:putative glutamine amidotransferase
MMRIAVSQRVVVDAHHGERRDALAQDWARWVAELDRRAVLVPIPNVLEAPAEWLDIIDPALVVLSGGNDVGSAPERDRTESALLELAATRRTPVLGVCRGLQIINRHLGGGITVGIAERTGHDHAGATHPVTLFGASSVVVNSFHDHGVLEDQVAPGLEIVGMGPGGVVEALRHESLPMAAVQWHPERQVDGAMATTFDEDLVRSLFRRGEQAA